MKTEYSSELDSIMLLMFDPVSLKIRDANDAALRFYGYDRNRFLSLTLNDLAPRTQFNRVGEDILNGIASRIFTHKKKNGDVCHVKLGLNRNIRKKGQNSVVAEIHDLTAFLRAKRFPKSITDYFRSRTLPEEPVFIIQWDSKLRASKINVETLKFFGWHEKGVIGKDIIKDDFIYPDDNLRFKSSLNEFLLGNSNGHELETRHLAFAGNTVLYRWYLSRILDKEGETVSVAGVGQRIFESKQPQETLVGLEDKFHVLTEEALVGVYLIQDGILRYVNPKFAGMFGYRQSEIIDKKGPLDFVIPEDRPLVSTNLKKRISGETNSMHYQFRCKHKNGDILYVDAYGTRTIYCGRPAVIGSMLDVTEQVQIARQLKESEERYHTIFEQAAVGIAHVNLDGRWLEVNQKFCKILGFSRDELLSMRFRDITHPDDLERDLVILKELVEGKKDAHVFEKRYLRKDNTFIWVQLTTSLVRDNEGKPRYIVTVYQDITERKRYTEMLRNSETSYRQLFNAIDDAIYILDADFHYVEVNDGITEMFGYEREEIIGEIPIMLSDISRVDMKQKYHYFTKAMNGQTQLFEWWGKRKNGEEFPLEILFSPGTYRGEKVVIATSRDITERYEVEQKLRENEELFRQLFQNSPIGIVMMDHKNEIKMVNNAFEEIFGYTNEELKGNDIDKLIVPDEYKDMAPELTGQAYSGRSFQVESVRVHKNGTLVPVLIAGMPVRLNNRTIAVYGLYIDITDRKVVEEELRNSEQRWQLLVENHPDAVIISRNFIIQFINKAGAKLYGVNKPSDLIGMSLIDLSLSENLEHVKKRMQLLKDGKPTEPFEFKTLGLDGKERIIEEQSVPIMYRGEQSVQTIARDITDRKMAQDRISRSLKEKEVLLAEIHHRVKNNLAVIAGLLQLKAFNTDIEEVKEAMIDSQRRVQSIALIHEKLYQSEDLSQIRYDTYLKELIRLVINSMDSSDKDIDVNINAGSVSLNINQAIPCGLILNELVTNAYKHAFRNRDEGKITIDLASEDDRVIFTVRDNGNGLPEDIDPGTVSTLGMTLIKTLAQQLNADLEMRNENGTLFILSFMKE